MKLMTKLHGAQSIKVTSISLLLLLFLCSNIKYQ